MNSIFLVGILATVVLTAGLTIMIPAVAQEDNATMAENETMGAENMTDTNMTEGVGSISGAEDPGF